MKNREHLGAKLSGAGDGTVLLQQTSFVTQRRAGAIAWHSRPILASQGRIPIGIVTHLNRIQGSPVVVNLVVDHATTPCVAATSFSTFYGTNGPDGALFTEIAEQSEERPERLFNLMEPFEILAVCHIVPRLSKTSSLPTAL